jgi:hypothetical protein
MKEQKDIANPGNAQVTLTQVLQQAELQVMTRIPRELRELEADLRETMWFDYRLCHPAQVTIHYAACYNDALRRFCEVGHDRDKLDKLRVNEPHLVYGTRESTAFTIARQSLDRIGCRYEWAMHFLVNRYIERGWRAMPRPNQLYGEELLMDLRDAWKTECAASLQIPKSHGMKVIEGLPLTHTQRQYADWVFGQVRARTRDFHRPLSRLLTEQVVSRDAIELEFGTATLERSLRAAGLVVSQR